MITEEDIGSIIIIGGGEWLEILSYHPEDEDDYPINTICIREAEHESYFKLDDRIWFGKNGEYDTQFKNPDLDMKALITRDSHPEYWL